MSEIHHPMELEASTFECPTCGNELPTSIQLTHEVACARMQRQNDQQRAPMAQPIVRQSSSSAIPEPSNPVQQRQQPLPRREDRRVENKLVTCPNCEKSVREQDINSHMDNECLKNETIPCEFCDEGIPMSNYSQHVDSCPRRPQNNRDPSPIRARPGAERQMPEEEEEEEEPEEIPHHQPNERDRSPERGSSQGGFRGFLKNLAGSAANQLRNLNQQQPQESSFLSHLFGAPETAEQQEQRRQQRQREQEERRREILREREMLEHMFGQPQGPRNLAPSNQNSMMPYSGGNAGTRVIRTIERGPGGSIIMRSRVVPANGQIQPQMNHPMEVNPLEMLLGMMSGGGFGGMPAFGEGGMRPMAAPEETGLDKETIASLATMKYNKEANKNLDEELRKCPICLDDFEDGQEVKFLWCTHRFHRGCVDTWLDKHTTCPICKKDFKEAEQGFE